MCKLSLYMVVVNSKKMHDFKNNILKNNLTKIQMQKSAVTLLKVAKC